MELYYPKTVKRLTVLPAAVPIAGPRGLLLLQAGRAPIRRSEGRGFDDSKVRLAPAAPPKCIVLWAFEVLAKVF